jgi:hypothetical protein
MTDEDRINDGDRVTIKKGYQPINNGYQPTSGNLDTSNPPGASESGQDSSSQPHSDSGQSSSESSDSQ